MSASTKALLIIVAVGAFAVGIVANSVRHNNQVSDQIETDILLSAKLMVNDDRSVATVKQHLGKLTLVNFWASWCAPCREEMPLFQTMLDQIGDQGFQILGIAIDSPEKAQPMLDSMDIRYPILYAERSGMTLMSRVGNPQGLLPYSLLLDKNGEVLEQVLGRIHEQDILQWVEAYL